MSIVICVATITLSYPSPQNRSHKLIHWSNLCQSWDISNPPSEWRAITSYHCTRISKSSAGSIVETCEEFVSHWNVKSIRSAIGSVSSHRFFSYIFFLFFFVFLLLAVGWRTSSVAAWKDCLSASFYLSLWRWRTTIAMVAVDWWQTVPIYIHILIHTTHICMA